MSNEIHKQSLEAAKDELAKLLRDRKAIDERIAVLGPLVEYLSGVVGDSTLPIEPSMPSALDFGLSDAIRYAFKAASPNDGLTATEVRDKLREAGYNMDKYAYELPPIHNTIARLAKAGELEPLKRADGTKAHRWVSSLRRALLEVESGSRFGSRYASRFQNRFGSRFSKQRK